MNAKTLLRGTLGLAAALVAACHDHGKAPPPAPPPTSQSLSTAQVLAMAQKTSEADSPIAVNGGALTLNDTSETAAPISVGTM